MTVRIMFCSLKIYFATLSLLIFSFLVGISNVWSIGPGGVETDMEFWVEADSGVTVNSSNTVTAWTEKSSDGNIVLSVNGDPRSGTFSVNGNNAIVFDGSGDYFDGNQFVDMRLAFVVSDEVVSSFGVPLGPAEEVNGSTEGYFFRNLGNKFFIGDLDPTYLYNDMPTPAGFALLTSEKRGGSSPTDSTITINSGSMNLTGFGGGGGVDQHSSTPRIGRGSDSRESYAAYYNGRIAEIIIYGSSGLGDADVNKVESYLAIKYGITLDQTTATNYTNSSGTVTWTAASNSSHNNDIAGIGKDNESDMLQSTSSSINDDAIVTIGFISSSSVLDGDFLVWGNDNATTVQTTSSVPVGATNRLTRTWKIQRTGDAPGVTVEFDLTGLTVNGSSTDDFALLISDESDFSPSYAMVKADSYSSTTNIVTFSPINFSDGSYFTLVTDHAGILSVSVVSSTNGGEIVSPEFHFSPTEVSLNLHQIATATLGTTSDGKAIRINNSTSNPSWVLSVAASETTALWSPSSTISRYDFNDSSANATDGSDADSWGGQMTVNPSGVIITAAEEGCNNTGISVGSVASFVEGVTDSITIATAGDTAQTDCVWDLSNLILTQSIPVGTPADDYSLGLVLSVVAN